MSAALTLSEARQVLGVDAETGAAEVRRRFREAAKQAHPDRPGGDAARFRRVLEAYRVLEAPLALAAPDPVEDLHLILTPTEAMAGGEREAALPDGRRIRIKLPAGLREGERLRAAGVTFRLTVDREGETQVRGDDVWTTAVLPALLMAEGGRAAIETPLGKRIVWVTRKAAERGLIRLEGQGLPARAGRPAGSLFLRLAAAEAPGESAARQRLRRFAAAWAA
jgi:curved DNA-binding protein